MALVSDGSRICNANRVALAGIDESFALTAKNAPFIFCGGVDLAVGDSMTAAHTYEWFWRVVGGTFAVVGATGEIKYGADTVLAALVVANSTKRTNQTATSVESFYEHEGSRSANPFTTLTDDNSSESQIALNASDAVVGSSYEMMMRCTHAAGTTDVVFAAKIMIPHPPVSYSFFPKPKLRR